MNVATGFQNDFFPLDACWMVIRCFQFLLW